jgi:hypothetical protein
VVAERVDGGAAHFQVLARRVVLRDVGPHLFAQRVVERALAGDGRQPRQLGPARRLRSSASRRAIARRSRFESLPPLAERASSRADARSFARPRERRSARASLAEDFPPRALLSRPFEAREDFAGAALAALLPREAASVLTAKALRKRSVRTTKGRKGERGVRLMRCILSR